MFNKKLHTLLFISLTLLFTACSSNKNSKHSPSPYRPLNLNNKSVSFKNGAHDGCTTAAEVYKKDHEAFNNNFEYNEGWWAGRRNCEGREYAAY
jgi:hypothetical protein